MSELALRLIEKEKKERTGVLDLGYCGLKELPEELFELTWLKELNVCNAYNGFIKNQNYHSKNYGPKNNLVSLPSTFINLKKLEIFNIGGYATKWMVDDLSILGNLSKLSFLILGITSAKDYKFLSKLTNLKKLKISENGIKNIDFISNLKKLSTLILERNEITDLSALKTLVDLEYINLSDNKIENIKPLNHLISCQMLDISKNRIKNITPILPLIKKGIKIKAFWSSGNNGIFLNNNPFEHPPIEILKKGNNAVLNYYNDLKTQGTTELYEAKLLIIGEGGVGKTSLAKKLMNEAANLPKEEDTTKGIDIQKYFFQTKEGKDFRINIWDFGGQEIYHATHQFFLTKRSLYVLVDDTRKDDKKVNDASFNYWLETVELFGGNSPILIVQNEKGDRSKDIDLKNIQSKFSNVKDKYATNLLTCAGLPETKAALEFFIQQLPHIGQKLPKQWVKIRNKLEELGRGGTSYLSLKEYFEICEDHEIPEEDRALVLSQYLHDLGAFLHFQEDDLLKKVVILQNEWATDAVYRVLDCEAVKKAKGRFTRADLKTIWGDEDCIEKYKHMHGELLALMKNFELCYELESDKNTYLAPQLFPEIQPDYDWNSKDNLILRYTYGFMPKGLLSRFIVRMHHYVKDLKTAWKNGVVLQKEQTQAEIVSVYAQQEIRIRVRGKENKAFLDIIIEEFEQLHNQYEGIKVDKLIPCICTTCQKRDWKGKQYFQYEVLKNAYYKGIKEIQCQTSFEPVNVHRLISDTLIAKKMEGSPQNFGSTNRDTADEKIKHLPIDQEEIRSLIANNDLGEVFEILLESTEDTDILDEIALLKGRWRTNNRERRKLLISEENFKTEDQKIKTFLLAINKEW